MAFISFEELQNFEWHGLWLTKVGSTMPIREHPTVGSLSQEFIKTLEELKIEIADWVFLFYCVEQVQPKIVRGPNPMSEDPQYTIFGAIPGADPGCWSGGAQRSFDPKGGGP